MAKTDVEKQTKKLSAQITKDFTKLIKSFARNAAKGGSSNIAFVVGYMDAACGRSNDARGIPNNNILDYSRGWQAAVGKVPAKRKTRAARL